MELEKLLKHVAMRDGCDVEDIDWYSWPQVFGSSAGPSGIGGQTMTTFQVYAFRSPSEMVRYCAGKWRRWNGEFMQPW